MKINFSNVYESIKYKTTYSLLTKNVVMFFLNKFLQSLFIIIENHGA